MTREKRGFLRFGLTVAISGCAFAAEVGWTATEAASGIPQPGPVSGVSTTVAPAGTVTWQQMLDAEARSPRAAQSAQSPSVLPFMEGPAPREIGAAQGAPVKRQSAPLPAQVQPRTDTATAPSVSTGFLALLDNNATIPPDTNGAAGPSHLMAMLNSQVRIQNKTGGVISTVSLSTFWTSGTGLSGSPFDPKLIYDSLSGRWMAAADASAASATSKVFLAISATSDPTGAWNFFSLRADDAGLTWADFPGFGVNSSWIAITDNMFTVAGSSFTGVKMWVIDKASALAGGPLTISIFYPGFDTSAGFNGFTLKPALTFDPAQQKLYIVDNSGLSYGGTALVRMSEISGTGPAPTWSVTSGSPFTGTGLFAVANNFNPNQIDAAQSGLASTCSGGSNDGGACLSGGNCTSGVCRRVSTNDFRMADSVVRNGKIWCTHSAGLPASGTPDRTAVFWYQLDPALMASTGSPIVQSGVLDGGPDVHHFFPSIAANKYNDMIVGFSRSDAGRFVEGVATGRLGSDPLGTTAAISVLKAGEASYFKHYSGTRNRWGDYSAARVDPCNDTSFWTLQEYASTSNQWGTYWGKLTSGEANCPNSCVQSPSATANGTYASCAGTVSGALCALTCNSGYSKSGDALCTNGSWSTQTCSLAACPANAAGAPSCACNTGYAGTLTWTGGNWTGTCATYCGNGTVESGEQCDDGNTISGDCCSSSCQFESNGASCADDGNGCTDDHCNATGTCLHQPNTASCNDGLYCTAGDVCSGGVCVAGAARDCSDANVCTDDSCNESIDACSHVNNTAPCDNGNACALDTCAAGICVPGSAPLDCDDANPCTSDSCDPVSGCVNAGIPVDRTLCLVPLRTKILISDAATPHADVLKWQWNKGAAFDQAALGSPDTDTTYAICVFDMTASVPSLAMSVVITPSAQFWRSNAPRGWLYNDRKGTSFGAQRLLIKTGSTARTRMKLSAGGIYLPLPGPGGGTYFNQDPSVIVQMLTSGGHCWTSEFISGNTQSNTTTSFAASAP